MTPEQQIQLLKDEQFCLRHELKTLSGIINRNDLERWVPGFCGTETEAEHIARYNWVSQFTAGKSLLDIACGVGKGSLTMAILGKAAKVSGYDIDQDSVTYAGIRNMHGAVTYKTADAQSFHNGDQFDMIVSFETIEHLDNPEAFLKNASDSLSSDGALYVSTPISEYEINTHPYNPYHKTEWGFKSFQNMLQKHFKVEDVYVQLYLPKNPGTLKYYVKKILGRPTTVTLAEITKWDAQQYPISQMGKTFTGYQIVVCRKK